MKKNKLLLFLQILSVGLLASTLVFSQAEKTVDAEMIFLRASVIDGKGKAIENSQREQFIVKEDGVEQEITFFSDRKESASVLILLDTSSSVERDFRKIHIEQTLNFIQNNPENEYSILAFDDKITELADWGESRRQFTGALNKTIEPKKSEGGNTAFFDALIYALGKFKSGKHEKKVLLVFSDGQDNASKRTFPDILKELKKSDATVFMIELLLPGYMGGGLSSVSFVHLEELNQISGGKFYYSQSLAQVEKTVRQIESILNAQYVIGYIPKKPQKDKDWHKLEVRVSAANEKGKKIKTEVLTRAGYFAATR